jgi:hypothetical protein
MAIVYDDTPVRIRGQELSEVWWEGRAKGRQRQE